MPVLLLHSAHTGPSLGPVQAFWAVFACTGPGFGPVQARKEVKRVRLRISQLHFDAAKRVGEQQSRQRRHQHQHPHIIRYQLADPFHGKLISRLIPVIDRWHQHFFYEIDPVKNCRLEIGGNSDHQVGIRIHINDISAVADGRINSFPGMNNPP